MKFPRFAHEIYNIIRFTAFRICPVFTLKLEFKRHAGYYPNIANPRTFNEKLQWLKLYWFDTNATLCADKYSVRKYVEERGLGFLLNDLYSVHDSIDDINFENLPNEFVMKVTHGCGQNLICMDKSRVNWEIEKRKFKKWLNKSHYYDSLEWVYRDITPRIVVEKLIKTKDGKPPKDYKLFCFDGEPKFLFVATDRGDHTTKFDFYDLNWNHISVKNHYPNSGETIPKLKELDELIEYSRILSKGFPHVRVDFYIEDEKVIFGECTFFHHSGSEPFEPIEYDYKFGDYLKLPKC